MSSKSITFLLITILFSLSAFCQDKKSLVYYEKGEMAAKQKKYAVAQEFYFKAIERSPSFAEPHFKIGQYYALNRSNEKAKTYYEKAIELSPDNKAFMPAYSFLGSYYFQKGAYNKAKDYFQFALKNAREGSRYASQLEKQIAKCDFVILSFKNAYELKPEKLPSVINTKQKQYFPVLTADEQQFVFTARDGEGDEDIFISSRDGESWSAPMSISDSINTRFNEGTCSISADAKMIVFTSCEGRENLGSCDLFYSRKVNGEWVRPQNMGTKINSPYWDSQPSLSNDGRTLYFASNRPSGKGRNDIYYSYFSPTKGWAPAMNLGSLINTPGDEVSPFIHANGKTLFFASNYLVGMGGFDLFLSQRDTSGFEEPMNLGYPINTQEDQLAMFIAANGQSAYYSVDSGDSVNLYKFRMPTELMEKIEPTIYVKGRVVDETSNKGIESSIELYDLGQNELISSFKSDDDDGSFLAVVPSKGKYALYVSQKDHFFKRFDFDVGVDGSTDNPNLEVQLKRIEKEKVEILEHIYFDTGSYELLPTSQSELDKLIELATENPSLGISISGHTDDVGSEEDNQILSEKRAAAVVQYLREGGISSSRLKSQGFGESKPKVPNDTDENRQINRRIELSFF